MDGLRATRRAAPQPTSLSLCSTATLVGGWVLALDNFGTIVDRIFRVAQDGRGWAARWQRRVRAGEGTSKPTPSNRNDIDMRAANGILQASVVR